GRAGRCSEAPAASLHLRWSGSCSAVNHYLPHGSTIVDPVRSTIVSVSTIGDRLEELRSGAGLTKVEMAAVGKVSKQHYGRIVQGLIKQPGGERLIPWAKHFGVRLEWLVSGKLPKEADPAPPGPKSAPVTPSASNDDWSDVTGYAQAAGLGTGPEAAEWAETHKLKLRRESLAKKRVNPKHLAVMYGAGDSMEATIAAGDAILFDTSDTAPRHRGVYVLLVPGAGAEEYVVKRALVSKGAVSFVADNPEGDHDWKEPRPLADGLKVVGRVRWTGGWVK